MEMLKNLTIRMRELDRKARTARRQVRERGFTRELGLLLFMAAFAAGAGAKLVAGQSITIGYEDYRLAAVPGRVALDALPILPSESQDPTRGPQCQE